MCNNPYCMHNIDKTISAQGPPVSSKYVEMDTYCWPLPLTGTTIDMALTLQQLTDQLNEILSLVKVEQDGEKEYIQGKNADETVSEQSIRKAEIDATVAYYQEMVDENVAKMQAYEKDDLKWDDGKAMYSLILSDFLDEMAVILTKGEANHPKIDGTPSWQFVEPVRYLDALYRHLHKYRRDPGSLDKDMETDHMAHVAVNAMFLWWFGQQKEIAGGNYGD